jgi:hypothetical protein
MAKAAAKPITNYNFGEMFPEAFEINDDNLVKVSLRDAAGDLVIYTMEFAAMIQMVNLATALLNSNTAKVLAHIVGA